MTSSESGRKRPIEQTRIGNLPSEYFNLKEEYTLTIGCCSPETKTLCYSCYAPGHCFYEETDLSQYSNQYLHQHDAIELMLVLEGSCRHRIGEAKYLCKPGYCCIINKNTRHQEDILPGGQVAFITISDGLLEQIIGLIQRLDGESNVVKTSIQLNDMLHKREYRNYFWEYRAVGESSALDSWISSWADSVTNYSKNHTVSDSFFFMGHFVSLLEVLSDPKQYTAQSFILPSSREEQLFLNITKLLGERHGCVTRAELSSEFHYSNDYINRIIKKYIGKTTTEYIRYYTMLSARELLLCHNYTISQIMQILGFTNKTFFYQAFREQFGMNPKAYKTAFGLSAMKNENKRKK